MRLPSFSRLAALALIGAAACSDDSTAPPPPTTGAARLSGSITANRTLSKDTVYTISGFVYVNSGAVLTIPAGTRLVGDSAVAGSALYILRGARIEANGTAAEPIVFTSARAVGNRAPGDWGGLILVGNATVNRANGVIIEGSNASIPGASTTGTVYSEGTNDADNSGTLRYVRVEFGGFAVATDQELNSFTLAALGSGTTLEYLQAVAGLDDNFEWFGGTANARFLVSYESGDDHFDTSEGFRGRVQYAIAYQSTVLQPRPGTGGVSVDPQGFEVDGCNGTGCGVAGTPTAPPAGGNIQSASPYNMNVFANFTVVGPGAVGGSFSSSGSGGVGAVLRRGTGGVYVNGIIARWPRLAVSLRDTTSQNRLAADSLNFRSVLMVENGAVTSRTWDSTTVGVAHRTAHATGFNNDTTGSFAAIFPGVPTAPTAATTGASFDWTPATGSAAATGGTGAFSALTGTNGSRIAARAGTAVTGTTFRGAADPAGTKWWQGWTVYFRN
jgi:hypothetical protein